MGIAPTTASLSSDSALGPVAQIAGPPPEHPVDAEADIEVLRSVPKQFAIEDERTANWLVRRIMASRAYAQSVKDWAEHEQARAAREERTLLFLFGRQLEAWVKGEIEKLNGRRKSVPLPAGTVGFRTMNPCLQVDDEQLVLNWCQRHLPPAIVIVHKLSRTILKDHFEKTGEMPEEGAHVDPGGERFFIR